MSEQHTKRMQTQTVVNAVNQLNAARQREVERQAECLVVQIRNELSNIKGSEEVIAAKQVELKKTIDITTENIFGSALPTGNANAKVIEDVIKKQQVESPASCIVATIGQHQSAIKACNERIAEARKKMNELVAQNVTVDEIVGKK